MRSSVNIKKEEISFDELKKFLSEKIKEVRKDSCAQNNCTRLSYFVIQLIRAYLSGTPMPEKTRALSSPSGSEVRTHHFYKNSQNGKKNEIIIGSSKALRAKKGLYSDMPYPTSAFFNAEKNTWSPVIDLEKRFTEKTSAQSPEDLHQQLIDIAIEEKSIIFGHIELNRNDNNSDHTLVFCANREEVFYVESQICDKNHRKNEPVLDSLRYSNFPTGEKAYHFTDEPTPKGIPFDTRCFYLVHGYYRQEISSQSFDKNTSSELGKRQRDEVEFPEDISTRFPSWSFR